MQAAKQGSVSIPLTQAPRRGSMDCEKEGGESAPGMEFPL